MTMESTTHLKSAKFYTPSWSLKSLMDSQIIILGHIIYALDFINPHHIDEGL